MKVLVIKSHKESLWVSCKTISSNLQRLYIEFEKVKGNQVVWFSLDVKSNLCDLPSNNIEILELANIITNEKPDKLVFIDHLPGPYSILYQLTLVIEKIKIPAIAIHLYGDFTYFANDWYSLSEFASGHDITFIVASNAQKRLVESFLNPSSTESVKQLCFPVNANEFNFNATIREQRRDELGLSQDDFVIIYSGRISTQKNVDVLIEEFEKIKAPDPDTKLHLWIVGEFDDHGVPFLGFDSILGGMHSTIQEILNRMPTTVKERITFWGHKNKEEIAILLNSADMFASFSLYHDEDYGMSPAEALSTGLPVCLTHWGGYYSFFSKDNNWECELVPVELASAGFNLEINKFHNYLNHTVACNEKVRSERQSRSTSFLNKFGINANISELSTILAETKENNFPGFNWLLNSYWKNKNSFRRNFKANEDFYPQTNNYYHQIYQSYLKST